MFDMRLIGKNIKDLREDRALRQDEVANFLGIDQSTLARIESGTRKINVEDIDKLADLFCCPIESILEGKNINNIIKVVFKYDNLDLSDLENLAQINRIVRNQDFMDKIGGLYDNEGTRFDRKC